MTKTATKDEKILRDILAFFKKNKVFEQKRESGQVYAAYSKKWLKKLLEKDDKHKLREEATTARTTKKLQAYITHKYPEMVSEAHVAEGMTLRFKTKGENLGIDYKKMQCFDLLDEETGAAFEISLSDAFAEFFKDVLKALLDSRVKKLYILMREHTYKGANKSGFSKVNDSPMVKQYITLAKLYKLEIKLVKIA